MTGRDPDALTGCADDQGWFAQPDMDRADPDVGEVQWHCSDPDGGGPDVGILMGLGGGNFLWLGELLDEDGGGMGFIAYADGKKAEIAQLGEYHEVREVLEQYVAPAMRRAAQSGKVVA